MKACASAGRRPARDGLRPHARYIFDLSDPDANCRAVGGQDGAPGQRGFSIRPSCSGARRLYRGAAEPRHGAGALPAIPMVRRHDAVIDMTPLLRLYARLRRRQLARQDRRDAAARIAAAGAPRGRTRFGRDARLCLDPRYQRVPEQGARCAATRISGRTTGRPAFPTLADITLAGADAVFCRDLGHDIGRDQIHPGQPRDARSNRRAALDLLVITSPIGRRATYSADALAGRRQHGAGRHAPGVRSGDLSGIAAATMPFWARPFRVYPPPDIALPDRLDREDGLLAERASARRAYAAFRGRRAGCCCCSTAGAPPSRARARRWPISFPASN